jgi:hypothetical protein
MRGTVSKLLELSWDRKLRNSIGSNRDYISTVNMVGKTCISSTSRSLQCIYPFDHVPVLRCCPVTCYIYSRKSDMGSISDRQLNLFIAETFIFALDGLLYGAVSELYGDE